MKLDRMKILPNGVAVVEGDLWHADWCSHAGGLDHDGTWMETNVCRHLKPDSIAVNAGVNIGTICEPLLRAGAEVYGFEPLPAAYEACLYNCRHHASQLRLHKGALWSKAGRGEILLCGQNAGATQVQPAEEGGTEFFALDDFGPFEKPVSVIVLDAEGAEGEILLGAEDTIREHRPALIIEINRPALRSHGWTAEQVFDLLESFGYRELNVLQHECSYSDDQYDLEALYTTQEP